MALDCQILLSVRNTSACKDLDCIRRTTLNPKGRIFICLGVRQLIAAFHSTRILQLAHWYSSVNEMMVEIWYLVFPRSTDGQPVTITPHIKLNH